MDRDLGSGHLCAQRPGSRGSPLPPTRTHKLEENKNFVNRCAECVLYGTHKCTQRRQRIPIIPEDKKTVFDFTKPGTWQRYIDWFYTYKPLPIEHYKWITIPILKTDLACDNFIPFR